MDRSSIRAIINVALSELNQSRPGDRKVDFGNDTVLFGAEAVLESVEVVNLIVSTEVLLEERLGVLLELADDPGLWQNGNSMRTVDTFADYVVDRLQKKSVNA